MCLVQEWKTGLTVKNVTPKLSHQRIRAKEKGKQNSFIKVWIQIISIVLLASDLYSTSVLDPATVCCFFKLRNIKCFPKRYNNSLWIIYHRDIQPNQHWNMHAM